MWSLGISLVELALGRSPFADLASDNPDLLLKTAEEVTSEREERKGRGASLQGGGMTMSIFELLQNIVNDPPPRLTPEGRFPQEAEHFVECCLYKDPEMRKSPKDLLVCIPDALLATSCADPGFRVEAFVDRILERSHSRPGSLGIDVLILVIKQEFS